MGSLKAADARHERGVVLVVVLWLLVLLAVLVGTLAMSARVESELVRNRVESLQARSAAEGGLFLTIDQLAIEQGQKERTLRTDGNVTPLDFHGVSLLISVQDEAGKMDINSVAPEMLRRLLIALTGNEERGTAICDAILDWRDADSTRREHGAEDDDYRKGGFPYGAKDEYLDNLEELLLVMGIDSDLYAKLLSVVTVSTGQKGINPLVAERRVLLAVPGVTPEQVDEYLRARERYYEDRLAEPLFPVIDRNYISQGRDQLYTIHVQAQTPGGTTERIAALVRVSAVRARDDAIKPYEILSWYAVDQRAMAITPEASQSVK